MKRILIAVMAILVLSCNANKEEQQAAQKSEIPDFEIADTAVTTGGDNGNKQKLPPVNAPATPVTDWTKKIIKTAELSIETRDYHAFNTSVHHTLGNFGAYIASEQQVETDEQITNTVSIKVPVDRFEALLNQLTSDRKNKVLQKQISSMDVSTEYVDTRSRIETKKQVRAKYYDLLKQARKMDEVLQVQSEINGITEDIEAASGRLQYLGHQSAYSTIHLRYFQAYAGSTSDRSQPGFFTSLVEALKQGGSIVLDLVLVIAHLWPVLTGAFLLWLFLRKRGLFNTKTGS